MQEQSLMECYAAIRSWIDIRIKLISIYGAVVVSSVIFGLREQSTSLILLAALIMLVYLFVDILVRALVVPYFVLGLHIEKSMNLENGIAHMYMRMYPGGADFAVLQQLYAEGDKRKIRREFLRKFYRPFGFLSSFVHAMIFFQLALLLSTCFILTYMFDWSFFP